VGKDAEMDNALTKIQLREAWTLAVKIVNAWGDNKPNPQGPSGWPPVAIEKMNTISLDWSVTNVFKEIEGGASTNLRTIKLVLPTGGDVRKCVWFWKKSTNRLKLANLSAGVLLHEFVHWKQMKFDQRQSEQDRVISTSFFDNSMKLTDHWLYQYYDLQSEKEAHARQLAVDCYFEGIAASDWPNCSTGKRILERLEPTNPNLSSAITLPDYKLELIRFKAEIEDVVTCQLCEFLKSPYVF
jgi:hypothetical protein